MSSTLPFKVTLGVTGGIAAYKAAEIVRALQQNNLDVHVVMTRAAEEFVRPLTFASLTGHKVITSMWGTESFDDAGIEHIAEAQSTGLLLIAPATAHTMAKLANGLADDFLSTLCLATTAPVMLAPAMNVNMWNHAATCANLETLRQRGVEIIAPGEGYLACGMTGGGRLADLDIIVQAVLARINRAPVAATPRAVAPIPASAIPASAVQPAALQDFAGESVLITAGGTREPIDPVRFLGNRSSGRMGYALAEAAAARGARVTLISAPSVLPTPAGCERINVTTAAEMQAAVLAHLPEATIVIGAAAVSDFRLAEPAAHKLKRSTGPVTLQLEPTEDMLKAVTTQRKPGTLVIAFAAETENLVENARAKLLRKAVDAIVANDVSVPHLGFDSENNAAIFLSADREITYPEKHKSALAVCLLNEVIHLRVTAAAH